MTSQTADKIDLADFESAATRLLRERANELRNKINEVHKAAHETANAMRKDDLRQLLTEEFDVALPASADKSALTRAYVDARANGTAPQVELNALRAAAEADRRAAEKINQMAGQWRAMEDQVREYLAKHSLKVVLRGVQLTDVSSAAYSGYYAGQVITDVINGKEFRQALQRQLCVALDQVLRYPANVHAVGAGPSPSRLDEFAQAAGAADFVGQMTSVYAADPTMTIQVNAVNATGYDMSRLPQ